MSRRYEHLTDEELAARIVKFTDGIEEASLGGGVARIQTDGRLMEIVQGNIGAAEKILGLLIQERDCRANGGRLRAAALNVRIERA